MMGEDAKGRLVITEGQRGGGEGERKREAHLDT